MKRYMLSILPLFLALCLMAGCGGRSAMHSRLAAVDSIVDSRYDSALTVLRGMDTLQMRRSDRMYLELLRAKAMNKASVPFTTDSVMRRVARYYDRHGSANQRLLAHYLLGCVYRDLGSAPRALEEYQRAASQADTTRADCDLPTLMRVYSQMGKLYMMMRLTDESLQTAREAQKVCYLMGDSLTALIFEEKYCFALCNDGKYRECIEATQKLYDYYMDRRMEDDAALVCIYFAQAYNGLGDFPQARHYLDMYERNSYLRTDPRKIAGGLGPYYICSGNCFLGLGMPDSAEVSFRKATKDMHNMQNESTVYNGLLRTFILKRETDSICKYADLANDCIMQDFNASIAEDATHVKSIYDYGVEQKIAREQDRRATRWKNIAILLIAFAIVMGYYFGRKKAYSHHLLQELKHRTEDLDALKQKEATTAEETVQHEQQIQQLMGQIDFLSHEIQKTQPVTDEEKIPLGATAIVARFRRCLVSRNEKPLENADWQILAETTYKCSPAFCAIMKGTKKLNMNELRLCQLILCGFEPFQIDDLLGMKHSYSSKTRQRLHQKVFGTEGTAADFDRKLRRLL